MESVIVWYNDNPSTPTRNFNIFCR